MGMTAEELQKAQERQEEKRREQAETEALQRHLQEQGLLMAEIPELDSDRLEKVRSNVSSTFDQNSAELLRRGIQKASVTTNAKKVKIRPVSSPPDFSQDASAQAAGLSDRKKKKLKNRQKDNQEKAQKKGYHGATGETLPLQKKIETLRRKEARDERPINLPNWTDIHAINRLFTADMFVPSFDVKTDTSIDVEAISDKIRTGREALRLKRDDGGRTKLSLEQEGAFEHLSKTVEAAEYALSYVVGANGVSLSGIKSSLSQKDVDTCRAQRAAAVAKYRDLVENGQSYLEEDMLEKLRQTPQYHEGLSSAEKDTNITIELELGLCDQMRVDLEEDIRNGDSATKSRAEAKLAERKANLKYYNLMKASGIKFEYFVRAGMYMDIIKFIDIHSDKYQEHKDVIDKMFAEYSTLEKYFGEISMEIYALNNGKFGITYEEATDLAFHSVDDPKNVAVRLRTGQLFEAMQHLLTGDDLSSDTAIMLENEFGIESEQRESDRAALSAGEAREQRAQERPE